MADFDVMILGAGAVGCVVGGYLCKAGYRVQLVNRNADTSVAVKTHGLRIETENEILVSHPDAVQPHQAAPARFILCFTKTYQTSDAVLSVLPQLDKQSIFVTMQNGLGNGEMISHLTGHEVLQGVTLIPASVLEPAYIRSHGAHKSWLGPVNPDSQPQITAAQTLSHMLSASGVKTEYHLDVSPPIWQKACFNVAMNGVSALADASPGLIGDTAALVSEVHLIADEAIQVGQALGVSIDQQQMHDMISFACAEHRYHQPSMLQDVRHQRKTEIASLNRYIVDKAQQIGIDVPRCALIAALIEARENAPEFWKAQTE